MRLKDCPRLVTIGENVWTIQFVKSLDGNKDTGECDSHENVIRVRLGLTPEERLKTIIHEIFHAWEYEYGLSIPHKLIYALEEPITDFIAENLRFG